ncbi:MAG TPA: nucleotide kinase domain-containing protein [Candidatus Binatia bacterium]|nr:nucleotide kinase domain-containing protein [Candidatus Binatia bacterium]
MTARRYFRVSPGLILSTTPVFETYWRFAYERQEIFYRRLSGDPQPWTDDAILRAFRFTNVYRASDRVSQYLIRHVIYEGSQTTDEIFFRVFLFKIFNRIETWERLVESLQQPAWSTFDFRRYDRVLGDLMRRGERIYSAAYIVPPPDLGRVRKHSNHLLLLTMMMRDRLPDRLAEARNLRETFELLRAYPSLGDFLAFQFSIDLNYGPFLNFSEMEHVVAGPGARSGIRKAFSDAGGLCDEDVIRAVAEHASREFAARGLSFRSLWGRSLQLIDCQNLFCEVDKYSRVAHPTVAGLGRTRIKRRFAAPKATFEHWYPPKWRLAMNRAVP